MDNVRFFPALMQSFKHFAKGWLSYLGLFALAMGVVVVMLAGVFVVGLAGSFGGDVVAIILSVLLFAVMIAYSVWVNLSFVAFGLSQCKKKALTLGAAIKGAFKNVWKGVVVSFYSGWYVVKWPLLIMLGMAIIVAFVAGSGMVADLMASESQEALMNIMYDNMAALGSLGVVFALGMISSMVIFFVRILKSIFSLYVFVEQGLTGNAAVMKSVEIVKGKWWRLFFYYVLLLVGFSIINAVAVSVAESLNEYLAIVVSLLFSFAMGPVTVLFLAQVYLGWKK
ncbi:hypothetical protein COU74_02830 [Candidatus Peregrinibacteria bacterium CG10_big_fil_rev_8_21_14_0_10_36_19]|nr:MAG: hypothetical protein COU74_02830 [Candidatus Peregrinibacteria bacterium CG10_big_fil_rev_8_21_14_0_10_36_19]